MLSARNAQDNVPMDEKQGALRSLLIAMTVVPTVVITIRFWSRALLQDFSLSKMPIRFWWDDWIALAAAILNIVVCGLGIKLVNLGMGLHIEVVDPANIELFLKLLWVTYYFFDTGTAIAKTSALFFYARIFGVVNPKFRYSLWIVHALNAFWLIGFLGAVTFQCTPVEKAWKPSLPGRCSNTGVLWLAAGISSLVIDILILLMPIPMLWKLRMRTTRKIQVIIVFLCGYLVVVVSIGRLVTISEAGTSLEKDPTYMIATPVLWLGSEIAISVTSISLPSILFLAQRAYRQGPRSLFSSRAGGSASRLVDSRRAVSDSASQDDRDTEFARLNNSGRELGTGSYSTVTRADGEPQWISDDQDNGKARGITVVSNVTVS